MASFLTPPAFKPERTDSQVDSDYKRLRWQVFIGIFIGYAGFYLVRKNLSMAIPMLEPFGFTKGELGTALAMNAVAYGVSKFVMASISDRSNARRFLPLGLILSSIAMMFMIVPIQFFAEQKALAIFLMAAFNFMVGWFQGMGWPPCGRVMTRWFSIKERGTWMSVWNCAHNVGGALVGPMAAYGAAWFGSWFYGANEKMYFLIGTYAFPAAVATLIAIIAYVLIRDTPQSCGLPSIEKWSGSASKNYDAKKSEQSLSVKEIFKTVLTNKFLWYIALANSFIYMVRYGCLDWAPTILSEQGEDIKSAGWAYFAYEIAAIPGTIFCGWLSDKVFNGRRAMPTMLFMALIIVAIVIYWQNMTNLTVVICCLIAIGFLIYGPVMLIGVQALDLAPKNAAGTAAGLTGFMGYVLGTAILANSVLGYVAQATNGWDWPFILLIVGCLLAIFFMALTYKEEQYLVADRKGEKVEEKK
ncbi:MAG: MFS transporter [Muribaculaceae bacterium]|jgi:phosphoglycerate transporter family protein|nr:MFS transporter [Muribaculaceae bacterium]MBQ4005933.1 MFS transporter [Muribaculaceae bacterium]